MPLFGGTSWTFGPLMHKHEGSFFQDRRWRETPAQRFAFKQVQNAERQYQRQLNTIARYVGDLIRAFVVGGTVQVEQLRATLNRYAEILAPWARAAAAKMLADVNRRDERAWFAHANLMGAEVQKLLRGPTDQQLRVMLDAQVDLITSLPRDAAQRVHDLTMGNLYEGLRGEGLVAEILRTSDVTRSRAELIARTEVARTGSNFTQLRAESVGSTHYIWRAAHDRRVRDSHHRMNGQVVAWADPPLVDIGTPPYHAGCIYNCRCYAEPIITI